MDPYRGPDPPHKPFPPRYGGPQGNWASPVTWAPPTLAAAAGGPRLGLVQPRSRRPNHAASVPCVTPCPQASRDDSVWAYASRTRGGADSGFADSRGRAED